MSIFGGKWRFSAGAAVELPFFSVLQLNTFNSENLKKKLGRYLQIAPGMASPNFLNRKRHISPTPLIAHDN